MNAVERAIRDLVIANRILGHEDITDVSGHVSVRHPGDPQRYLLSRARSPEMVEEADIREFTLDGTPLVDDGVEQYAERFIHGAIYEAQPDIKAVVHAHAEAILPFSISDVPLRPVIGAASNIGATVPVWDIREKFGDRTNLLVQRMDQGRELARSLGSSAVILMRGHGFAAARTSLVGVVRLCIFLQRNARVQLAAKQLGGAVIPLSPGEIEVKTTANLASERPEYRGWEYWAARAGCRELLAGTAETS
jgi:ribulose-5-phosphate 4-epimerase/fuculose-1-phosphate aldolase